MTEKQNTVSTGKDKPDILTDEQITQIRTHLSRAMRKAELAFIHLGDRDGEIARLLLKRFVDEAREVHKLTGAIK